MSSPCRIFCVILLAICAGQARAGICKWVDADGVVHYAERCPANMPGTEVRTEEGPTPQQVEEARKRSEQLRGLRDGRENLREQESARKAGASHPAAAERHALEAACDAAYRERAILELELPVYRDEKHTLYYHDSLNYHWNEENRTYLDDSTRQAAADSKRQFIDANCEGVVAARADYIFRFYDAPPLNEIMDMLRYIDHPESPPAQEVCAYSQFYYAEMDRFSTGLPSDNMRELENLIRSRCR